MNSLLMAPIGTKVKVTEYYLANVCRKECLKKLIEGRIYTIKKVRIGTFSSVLSFEELSGGGEFNHIFFESIEDFIPVSEEEYKSRVTYKLG